jgi:hypothetical protein
MIMESEWRRLNNAKIAVRLDELSLNLHKLLQHRPIPVAVPSKAKVWNSWTAEIGELRRAQDVHVLLWCLLCVV